MALWRNVLLVEGRYRAVTDVSGSNRLTQMIFAEFARQINVEGLQIKPDLSACQEVERHYRK